jgi:hypothetical protein
MVPGDVFIVSNFLLPSLATLVTGPHMAHNFAKLLNKKVSEKEADGRRFLP